ncbi:MRG-domain-containing protein [Schizophyllum amplum]|uniref:Chromatin modification-related protein EAF3 n=1 Tax=Schizophyllum amplum TaxID=97359 RepID=A0A550CH72_9AGAR|nr:MRG-domain-containing protein [Auriculariopsis ampla]
MSEPAELDDASFTQASDPAQQADSEPSGSTKAESQPPSMPVAPSKSPSTGHIDTFQVSEVALTEVGGTWYKTRITEAETSSILLAGPVKSRKQAGLPSLRNRRLKQPVKKTRESSEPADPADAQSWAAHRVYRVHYEGFNAFQDEWMPAFRLRKAGSLDVSALRESTPGMRSSAGPTIVVNLGDETLSLAVPRGRLFGEVRPDGRGRRGRGRGRGGFSSISAPAHVSAKSGKKAPSIAKPFKIEMPSCLRSKLVDDWERVQKQNLVVKLPRAPNVDAILLEFQTYLEIEAPANLCEPKIYASTVTSGIKVYFEKAIGHNLLYPLERSQFDGWRTQFKTGQHVTPETTKDMSEAYGVEHLLRLLANFPQYMTSSDLDPGSIHLISEYVNEFLRWLDLNRERLFVDEYLTEPEYFRMIGAMYGRPVPAAAAAA